MWIKNWYKVLHNYYETFALINLMIFLFYIYCAAPGQCVLKQLPRKGVQEKIKLTPKDDFKKS